MIETENGWVECEHVAIERVKTMWEKSGISKEQQGQFTFQTFNPYTTETKEGLKRAAEYCRNFETLRHQRKNSLAFLGNKGTGKSHLTLAIAINLINKGVRAVYMQYRDVMTYLKQNMTNEEKYQSEVNKYRNADLLLIDDLYKGKTTETDPSIMFEIVNHRYINQLPMIVSSEFKADRLMDFDEAVGSRIIEMCKDYIVEFSGENYRLRGL